MMREHSDGVFVGSELSPNQLDGHGDKYVVVAIGGEMMMLLEIV